MSTTHRRQRSDDAYDVYEKYEMYEEMYDPRRIADRKARRRRSVRPRKKQEAHEVVVELTDDVQALEGGFTPTYTPSRHEEGWLLDALRSFYEQALITDVLAMVKGGKEASVYRCAAHPSTGQEWLAAKVYRPQKFRSLSNDKVYRQGRVTLTAEGHTVRPTEHRIIRAIGKKTAFGRQVSHTSWLMHENTTLESLYQAGGAVPKPFGASENALLMGYVGDGGLAAPTLNRVRLEPGEAERLFQEMLRNIELMLEQDLVHGDLSAYNVLYWEGEITLIDFPQVVNVHGNRHAHAIFRRDVQRVCEYFAAQGVACDARDTGAELWERYVGPMPDEREMQAYNLQMAG